MSYLLIKHLHMTFALLSISGFVIRGIMQLLIIPIPRWLSILPHIIDTALLSCAILLCIYIKQYPFFDAWLTAKLIALLLYIGFGLVALRFAQRRRTQALAFFAALLCFFYIFSVATSHNAYPWLSFTSPL